MIPLLNRIILYDDPVDAKMPDLNDRQTWFMVQLHCRAILRIGDVMDQFGCSKTTAKRDLTDLRRRDLILFHGAPRTGSWQLRNP